MKKISDFLESKETKYDNFYNKKIKFKYGINKDLYTNSLYGNNDDYLDYELTRKGAYYNKEKRLKWFEEQLFYAHVIYKNNELKINQKRYYMDNYNPRLFSKFNILSDQKDDFSLRSTIYGSTYIVDNEVVLYTKRISDSYPKHIKIGCDLYISVIETEKKKIDLYSINLCESKQIDE